MKSEKEINDRITHLRESGDYLRQTRIAELTWVLAGRGKQKEGTLDG